MAEKDTLHLLAAALDRLNAGWGRLPAFVAPAADVDTAERVLNDVAARLSADTPNGHPFYVAHMQKPPHPVARLAYALALSVNANAHDPSTAAATMEREALAAIAAMFGWDGADGHLCSGGTIANAEALWVASRLRPGRVCIASAQAHPSHARFHRLLGVPFETIGCDTAGRIDVQALAVRLARGDVGTVVATIGTTSMGAVDPLPRILELRTRHDVRVHADASYGGYFGLADHLAAETRAVYDALPNVDSVAIDPHKHGLQPYGCGCVVFRDNAASRLLAHRSRYVRAPSETRSSAALGFECSRPAASAIALWATLQALPLTRGGAFAGILDAGRSAAVAWHRRLAADRRFVVIGVPDLDIVVWTVRASRASDATALVHDVIERCARREVLFSCVDLPASMLGFDGAQGDRRSVTCLRAVFMKPEHVDWLDRLWDVLSDATDDALAARATTSRPPRRAGASADVARL